MTSNKQIPIAYTWAYLQKSLEVSTGCQVSRSSIRPIIVTTSWQGSPPVL